MRELKTDQRSCALCNTRTGSQSTQREGDGVLVEEQHHKGSCTCVIIKVVIPVSRSDIPTTCAKELSKEVGRKRERGQVASQGEGHRHLRVDVGSARPWEMEQGRKYQNEGKTNFPVTRIPIMTPSPAATHPRPWAIPGF